jgi:hypothetical protein
VNDDIYLIETIKNFFKITNLLKYSKDNGYYLEVYKKEVLLKIINHCVNYPLLGEKLHLLKRLDQKLSE